MIYQIIGKIWTRKLDNAIKRMDALVVLTERDAEKWKKLKSNCHPQLSPILSGSKQYV